MANTVFDPQLVIARLQGEDTPFRLVAGSIELEAAMAALKNTVPAAYVVPLADMAAPSRANVVIQGLRCRFGVVIALSNLRDPRGERANADLRTLRLWVIDTLLGWQPAESYDATEYGQGRLMAFRDGVLWWQEEYITGLQLRQQS